MTRNNTRHLVLAGVFAALTAVAGFLKLPFGPMSITLQTMLAALAGIVLGPKWGAVSQGVYLALGLMGLPSSPWEAAWATCSSPASAFCWAFP